MSLNTNISLLLVFLITGFFLVSCDNDSNDDSIRVLTEDDFAEDLILSADPSGGVIVTFLEHPDDAQNENQTGEAGVDIIPIRYNDTASHTFCWEDSNEESEHFMTLNRISGEEILKVEANGNCVTQIIEPGIYELLFNHDGNIENTFPVFIQNGTGGMLTEKFSKSLILYSFLEKMAFTLNASAQTVSDNFNTLVNTNSCPGCNLEGAGLSFKDLSDADLSGANLAFSQMIETNLTGADLSNADLSNADLNGANLTNADLSGATTSNTNLAGADLTGITL